MKKLIVALSAFMLLAGCSTSKVDYSAAKPVQANHIFNKELLVKRENTESVYFVRDTGFTGSACRHIVYIDNQRGFELSQGEGVEIHLPEGDHFFKLEMSTSICPDVSLSESTSLKLGEPQTFRVSINSNFQVMFSRTK